MLAIIELKTATLDYGIPGVSPARMLLIFLMMFAIPMIPYFFLYLSLREKHAEAPVPHERPGIVEKMAAWIHAHRHPALHHH